MEKYMQTQQALALQRRIAEEEKDWGKFLKPKQQTKTRVGKGINHFFNLIYEFRR